MTTPQMDWLDDQRRKRAVSSDVIVRRMELMDVPPGSYDEKTLYDAVAEIKRLRAEVERLRAALAIAAGMISTLPPYEDQHPETVMEMLLEEARRG